MAASKVQPFIQYAMTILTPCPRRFLRAPCIRTILNPRLCTLQPLRGYQANAILSHSRVGTSTSLIRFSQARRYDRRPETADFEPSTSLHDVVRHDSFRCAFYSTNRGQSRLQEYVCLWNQICLDLIVLAHLASAITCLAICPG